MKKFFTIPFVVLVLISQTTMATSFPDLSASHQNALAIELLTELQIVKGDSTTGNFSPARVLNRAEFAKIIVLAKGESIDNVEFKQIFPDIKTSDWFSPYIIRANELGIMKGTGEGKAEPQQPVKMVEALAMALRAFNMEVESTSSGQWYQPYLDKAYANNFLTKVSTQFDQGLPRSEAAQLVVNALHDYEGADPMLITLEEDIELALEIEKISNQNSGANIVINGEILSSSDLDIFVSTYGGEPSAGNYWYDSRSGFAGRIGYGVEWLLQAGHNFGQVAANASGGNTGVFINGREIPDSELLIYSYLVGPVPPDYYWLDANGDAGLEGENAAIVNLLALAYGSSNGSSTSGDGDNFWSASYSRGNSYDNNNSGYVFVEGVGSVGYGELGG